MFGSGGGGEGLLWEIFGLRPAGNALGPGHGWRGSIHLGLLPCGSQTWAKGGAGGTGSGSLASSGTLAPVRNAHSQVPDWTY